MYTHYFHLKQPPFSIAPDPRYLFMSERHREALAHLLYGVGSGGGFVLLTGEIGAGKTTVCRCFMEQIPENCKLAYIFNPKLSVEELLLSICDEFGIVLPAQGAGAVSVKTYVDAINAYLLASHAQGRNNVLIIDEAQNLSAAVLEQLRLLTNLETSERKLLQIILIGQPELRSMVAQPELEQLAQRVIARYHLGSLTAAETGAYVEHRLAVAGAVASAPFPRTLMPLLHKLTKGVPRRINLLCDRALLGAYVENQPQVTRAILRKAAAEVFASTEAGSAAQASARWPVLAAGVLGGVLLSAGVWLAYGRASSSVVSSAPSVVPAATALAGSAPAAATAARATSAATSGTAAAPAQLATAPQLAAAVGTPATAAAATGGVGTTYSQSDALRALAALWDLKLPDGEPCALAAKLNLRCLSAKGGLDELRQLDRPAVLTLHDDPVRPNYLLLTALGEDYATLQGADGKPQRIKLAALEARYSGEFSTYWRAPRSWRDEVSAGDKGPDVDWLARRLAQIYGLKKPVEGQPLNAALRARLTEFQSELKLKADGVAGPKTFIRLYQQGGVREPRLLAAEGK
ncbi:AAA family ATPase [Pseudoduganella sp. FT93W]|uniref:AAA family ATPase n=1 Tax=Duganella fentianensis TaxID=2692177 RepID=A0A845I0X7_9BURK|nr:ExeA family protein [Duganella fentianensis]MYN47254.1 AAA family ATPase [Duganella fentianensis]